MVDEEEVYTKLLTVGDLEVDVRIEFMMETTGVMILLGSGPNVVSLATWITPVTPWKEKPCQYLVTRP